MADEPNVPNQNSQPSTPPSSGKGAVVAVIVVLIIIIAGIAYAMSRNNDSTEMTTKGDESSQNSASNNNSSSTMEQGETKNFTVNGNNFSFSPSEIRVKKGDRVRVTFNNTGGFHDFVLDEFNAKTQQLADGKSETIEFMADKVGTFEFYCSVGTHRQMGMKGSFIVE